MSQFAALSVDLTMLPEIPVATKVLFPKSTPKRVFVVGEVMILKEEPISVDFTMVPLSPTTTNVLFPYATPYRFFIVGEVTLSKDAPLLVDFRMFPVRPTTRNTPVPEVEPVRLDELLLSPQEIIAEVKQATKNI